MVSPRSAWMAAVVIAAASLQGCTAVRAIEDTAGPVEEGYCIALMKLTGPQGFMIFSSGYEISTGPGEEARTVRVRPGENYLALTVFCSSKVFIHQYQLPYEYASFANGAISIGPFEPGLTYVGDVRVIGPIVENGSRSLVVRTADGEAASLPVFRAKYPLLFERNTYRKQMLTDIPEPVAPATK